MSPFLMLICLAPCLSDFMLPFIQQRLVNLRNLFIYLTTGPMPPQLPKGIRQGCVRLQKAEFLRMPEPTNIKAF